MRARVVLWSTGTPGLASTKHFASFFSDIVATFFFHVWYLVFFRCFVQPEPTLALYETKTPDSTSDTYVIRVHIHIYPKYIMIQLQHYSSVAACRGYTSEIQCTAVRMHV